MRENPGYRSNLEKQLNQNGIEHLQVMLKNLSEKLYEQTDLLNPRRIIRSIEIAKSSEDNKVQKNKNLTYDSLILGLNAERKLLHSRVRSRVNKMLSDGFIEEINTLIKKGYDSSLQSMSSIGYKEFINYVKGEYSKEEAIQKTIQEQSDCIEELTGREKELGHECIRIKEAC